jgi:hypothetical protein
MDQQEQLAVVVVEILLVVVFQEVLAVVVVRVLVVVEVREHQAKVTMEERL